MENKVKVRMDELLSALSLSVDLSRNRSLEHSRRTAYIAYAIAKNLNLTDKEKENIFYASFLHDIGICNMPAQIDIEKIHSSMEYKKSHSDIGYEIAKNLPFNEEINNYVLYHHENYDGSGPNKLQKDDIPLGAQIISIADFFDINHVSNNISKLEKVRMNKIINERRNKQFRPEVADCLLDIMKQDKFWLDLAVNLQYEILNLVPKESIKNITLDELVKIAEVFSAIIDGKIKHTGTHSKELGDMLYRVSKNLGYSIEKCTKMKISGYLHDIGKLAVPEEILNKPSNLTEEEFNTIKIHPYYTKLILSQVGSFREDIARWAGNHHERLNGNGYPERLKGDELSTEDQIVAICDIYQSLTENRPYRNGLSKNEALKIINNIVISGGFDTDVYKLLEEIL
ncbi:HD-GYP domain-containing protein [Alkalithermobacter paradoxus]|uniref:Cyclic di-GMP phosphodiesterase response regulator RpfG n=1 Tax=Alkalithermobacter paradoxus TaxID=29349 RepID=A0A1V4I617_9FIRM|nr:cyclic di-GMP phosphodiesterase response regulator RpfG [[Clostridium] thermoalcaliphilum]